jgi:hypothetical protein
MKQVYAGDVSSGIMSVKGHLFTTAVAQNPDLAPIGKLGCFLEPASAEPALSELATGRHSVTCSVVNADELQ